MKKLIVFDWDGTLCDSVKSIGLSMQAACQDIGISVPLIEKISGVIGLGVNDALHALGIELSAEKIDLLNVRFQVHYSMQCREMPLFEGVKELLFNLTEKGCRLAIATGKSRCGLDAALIEHQIESYFIETRCAEECLNKPNPLMLFNLLNALGFDPSEAIMVGDTVYDLQMATNAGLDSVAVTYGAHKQELLQSYSPLFFADSVSDLYRGLHSLTSLNFEF